MPSSSPVLGSTARWLSAALLAIRLATAPAAAQAQTDEPDPAAAAGGNLAFVDGQPITESELLEKTRDALGRIEQEFRRSRHELIQNQLDEMIRERLLDSEAAARGTTREALLASLTAAVTDVEVEQFYEKNAAQIPQPKEQVAPQIRAYLQQQRSAEAEKKLLDELKAKHEVRVLLEPFRAAVEAGDSPAMGPAAAPVTLIVFADFECHFCARVVPTLEKVSASYASTLRLVFRQFPLSNHAHAQKAAEASLCAHAQGEFWKMYSAIFAAAKQLEVENLKAKATELGLDRGQFDTCLDSGATAAKVRADLEAGMNAGVTGTPAMFVNGRLISGAVSFEQISAVIDDELKRKSGK